MAPESSSNQLRPYPEGVDSTAQALRRANWPKVVFVGSIGKAYDEMLRLEAIFAEQKIDALLPRAYFGSPADIRARHPRQAEIEEGLLIETHFLRIMYSKFAYIVNPGGYIGPNTAVDIGVTLGLGKDVYSMERIEDHGISIKTGGIKTPEEIITLAKNTSR